MWRLLWIGVWIVSSIVATVLQSVDSQQRRYAYYAKISVQRPEFSNTRLTQQERQQQWRAYRRAAAGRNGISAR